MTSSIIIDVSIQIQDCADGGEYILGRKAEQVSCLGKPARFELFVNLF